MGRFQPRGWSPFVHSTDTKHTAHLRGPIGDGTAWVNCHYVVQVSREVIEPYGEVTHLWIRNNDESTRHDWAEFQRIKDELCGKHIVAVEVYPVSDELVDDANIYHLWCWSPQIAPCPFQLKPYADRQGKVAR